MAARRTSEKTCIVVFLIMVLGSHNKVEVGATKQPRSKALGQRSDDDREIVKCKKAND